MRRQDSSEDEHFLENLGGQNDIFHEYCKA
jgi:hypothetical protein